MAATNSSFRAQARLAGWCYLYIIMAGIFVEGFVRGQIIDFASAPATAQAILAREPLYRAGLFLETLMMAADLVIAIIFYRIFAPVSHTLAVAGLVFRLLTVSVAAFKAIAFAAPLALLTNPAIADAASAETLSLIFLEVHARAYDFALFFFGIDCLIIGALIWLSGLIPRLIGAGMVVAGLCYLANTFANILAPPLAGILFPAIMLPCLIAELALTLWLVTIGLRRPPSGQTQPEAVAPAI